MKLKASVATQLLWILALWSTQALALGLVDQPSAVTYLTPQGDREFWVFAPSMFSRRLFADRWSGDWAWMDFGQPRFGEQVFNPSAISYPDASGAQLIWVFAQTRDGSLILAPSAGSEPEWVDLGRPLVRVGEPMAITYLDAAGFRQVRVFLSGSDGHLWVDAGGSFWQWFDLGLPDGVDGVLGPSAVFYRDGSGDNVRAFALASNGHLVVDSWDGGFGWRWSDLGLPAGASRISAPSAVAFVDDEGNAQTRVFAVADNRHLVMNDWRSGLGSTWVDIGLPDGIDAISAPTAITFDIVGIHFIQVFVEANDGHLYAAEWESLAWGWTWYDLGLGPGGEPVRRPTAISFVDESGVVQVRVYAEGSLGQLLEDAWDGTSWTWSDLGEP